MAEESKSQTETPDSQVQVEGSPTSSEPGNTLLNEILSSIPGFKSYLEQAESLYPEIALDVQTTLRGLTALETKLPAMISITIAATNKALAEERKHRNPDQAEGGE